MNAKRVLEIGAFGITEGTSAQTLIARGAQQVVSIDEMSLDGAFEEEGIEWREGSIEAIGEDETFDVIIVHDATLCQQGEAIDRLRQALSAGGHLIFVLPNQPDDEGNVPGYNEAMSELQARFASIELVSQTPATGCTFTVYGVEEPELSVDGSLSEAVAASYYLFACGDEPCGLQQQTLALMSPIAQQEAEVEAEEEAQASANEAEDAIAADLAELVAERDALTVQLQTAHVQLQLEEVQRLVALAQLQERTQVHAFEESQLSMAMRERDKALGHLHALIADRERVFDAEREALAEYVSKLETRVEAGDLAREALDTAESRIDDMHRALVTAERTDEEMSALRKETDQSLFRLTQELSNNENDRRRIASERDSARRDCDHLNVQLQAATARVVELERALTEYERSAAQWRDQFNNKNIEHQASRQYVERLLAQINSEAETVEKLKQALRTEKAVTADRDQRVAAMGDALRSTHMLLNEVQARCNAFVESDHAMRAQLGQLRSEQRNDAHEAATMHSSYRIAIEELRSQNNELAQRVDEVRRDAEQAREQTRRYEAQRTLDWLALQDEWQNEEFTRAEYEAELREGRERTSQLERELSECWQLVEQMERDSNEQRRQLEASARDNAELRRECDRLGRELSEVRRDLSSAQNDLNEVRRGSDETRRDLNDVRVQLHDVHGQLQRAQNEANNERVRNEQLQRVASDEHREVERLGRELNDGLANTYALQTQLNVQSQALLEREQRLSDVRQALLEREAQLHTSEESVRASEQAASANEALVRAREVTLRERDETLRVRDEQLRAGDEALRQRDVQLQESANALQVRDAEILSLRDNRDALNTELQAFRVRFDDLSQALAQAQNQASQQRAEFESQRQTVERVVSETQNQVEVVRTQTEQEWQIKVQALEARITSLRSDRDVLDKALDEARRELDSDRESSQRRIDALTAELVSERVRLGQLVATSGPKGEPMPREPILNEIEQQQVAAPLKQELDVAWPDAFVGAEAVDEPDWAIGLESKK